MSLTSGSLCTGFGGLSMAVEDALGARPLWCSEYEPPSEKTPKPTQAAARILAHRYPNLPNLGDMQKINWNRVREVDVTEVGYPCPGESAAGKRLGMDDPRWMWPAYFRLIREMRPKLAIGENVRGHVSKSFRYVVADLQSIGYAVVWAVVAASDVGACHERKRIFWVAYDEREGVPAGLPTDPFAFLEAGDWIQDGLFGGIRVDDFPAAGAAYAGAAYAGAAPLSSLELFVTPTAQLAVNGGSQHPDKRKAGGHGPTLADQVENLGRPVWSLLPTPTTQDAANNGGPSQHDRNSPPLNAVVTNLLPTPTATPYGNNQSDSERATVRLSLDSLASSGKLLPTPRATDGSHGGPNQRGSSGDLMLPAAVQSEKWGAYAAAVARWESLSRPAPAATAESPRGGPRLSPYFVEWMMDAPAGWIVDVPGITRNEALRAGGNGVVRRQGAAAIGHLVARIPASVLATRDQAVA